MVEENQLVKKNNCCLKDIILRSGCSFKSTFTARLWDFLLLDQCSVSRFMASEKLQFVLVTADIFLILLWLLYFIFY